jgi:hypothetical protein
MVSTHSHDTRLKGTPRKPALNRQYMEELGFVQAVLRGKSRAIAAGIPAISLPLLVYGEAALG